MSFTLEPLLRPSQRGKRVSDPTKFLRTEALQILNASISLVWYESLIIEQVKYYFCALKEYTFTLLYFKMAQRLINLEITVLMQSLKSRVQ